MSHKKHFGRRSASVVIVPGASIMAQMAERMGLDDHPTRTSWLNGLCDMPGANGVLRDPNFGFGHVVVPESPTALDQIQQTFAYTM